MMDTPGRADDNWGIRICEVKFPLKRRIFLEIKLFALFYFSTPRSMVDVVLIPPGMFSILVLFIFIGPFVLVFVSVPFFLIV